MMHDAPPLNLFPIFISGVFRRGLRLRIERPNIDLPDTF